MINKNLFTLLERRFGVGNVEIVREGEPMIFRYAVLPTNAKGTREMGRKTVLKPAPAGQGEEFQVDCPFCGDTKQRLSINHRWGIFDKETKSRNLWLMRCYNEECQNERGNQLSLYDQVYTYFLASGRATDIVGNPNARPAARRGPIKFPGTLWSLEDMLERSPGHPCLEYLESRWFDTEYLSKVFNVSFCTRADNAYLRNRIVAPVYWGGKMVAYQARLIRDPFDETEPKWYSSSSMGSFMYNAHRALRYQTKVIVEGPGDVWGVGLRACGLFKKSLSAAQIDMLVESHQEGDVVVVMLDPERSPDDILADRPHHIVTACERLENTKLKGSIVPVYLPIGRDPGDCSRQYMRDMIAAAADELKLKVDFTAKGKR